MDRIEVRETDGPFWKGGYGVFLDGELLVTCYGPRAKERAELEAETRRERIAPLQPLTNKRAFLC